jgi:hypothetical protein
MEADVSVVVIPGVALTTVRTSAPHVLMLYRLWTPSPE